MAYRAGAKPNSEQIEAIRRAISRSPESQRGFWTELMNTTPHQAAARALLDAILLRSAVFNDDGTEVVGPSPGRRNQEEKAK